MLEAFHRDLLRWFDGEHAPDAERELKSRINRTASQARQAVMDADCFVQMSIAPPAVIGGRSAQVPDLFESIFQSYWGLSVIPTLADSIERAIGAYEHQRAAPATDAPAPTSHEPNWAQLHPAVRQVAEGRYMAGHYADAVEAAMKSVNRRVKDLFIAAGRTEKDGTELMFAAFGGTAPAITLADLAQDSGRNIQQGYTHIFAGAMQGVRNPKAHDNIALDPRRTLHLLFLASLLMEKLDEVSGTVLSDHDGGAF